MKAKILVIDDEEGIRFTFKTFLSEEGHEVFTADSYPSAMEIIESKSPDLIFADILLDEHTGIEILREIRERGMQCPVVIITGQPDIDTASESVRLGAFDYLIKPVRQENLLRVTRTALEHIRIVAEKEKYRNNLDAVFRSVTDAIITVDAETRVTGCNPAVKDICGIAPQDVIGKLFHEAFGQTFDSCRKILLETLEKQAGVREHRMKCSTPNGSCQVWVVNSSPLTDHNNRPIGVLLVIKDVTRLNDLESSLKERNSFHNIIGRTEKMQAVFSLIEKLADVETTALITGETGTGKELIARAVHYSGVRSHKPLITVNCSALSESLLESELFGHVRGAFTGAVRDRAGCFQAADGGTLFLDEIGEISPLIQVKLLRVIQEKEFYRVGESVPVKVDVRVIAATNRRLEDEVKTGKFREDLYYRLKVVEIAVPPLRERRRDIPFLMKHFFDFYNRHFQKSIEMVTDGLLDIFLCYHWPGNVRELKHAIEHAFVLCRGSIVSEDQIPSEILKYSELRNHDEEKVRVAEAEKIIQALEKTDWNKAKAARILGVNRKTLYRQLRKHNVKNPGE